MTDTALLPPDPTTKAYYWLRAGTTSPGPWLWLPDTRSWFSRNMAGSVVRYAEGMASEGYTLASPHPIPGPAALEALHKLPVSFDVMAESYGVFGEAICKTASGAYRRAADSLRAALETKETTDG